MNMLRMFNCSFDCTECSTPAGIQTARLAGTAHTPALVVTVIVPAMAKISWERLCACIWVHKPGA